MAALPLTAAIAVGFVRYHNVVWVSPYPVNTALPLAGGWAAVGIVTTVFMVSTGRTGRLDRATRMFGEQAAGDGTGQPPAGS
jgi:hypothetical protein